MNKLDKLKQILKRMKSVILAYSGGVDSTFLLRVAKEVLRDEVLAVTARSPTYSHRELKFAREMARLLGARHLIIKTDELDNPAFVANPQNRCYFCKKELFSKLKKIAKMHRCRFVIDAFNLDDDADFRPGTVAMREEGIRSPLKEARFRKKDVRRYSRILGLPTRDMPSFACLASRFPYGTRITRSGLKRVERAEEEIRRLGFSQIRVRDYADTARIEVEEDKIPELLTRHRFIVDKLKKLGYNYVAVDLEGYRTGSMNEVLRGAR